MILNKAQAEAVYSAMCALNNVSAKFRVAISKNCPWGVEEHENGCIDVDGDDKGLFVKERYRNQAEFVAAYKLN